MSLQQRIGPLAPSADNTPAPLRGTRDGATATQEAHAKYQEAVYRGNVFVASNNAGSAIPTALAAACTGLILTNPPTSGKNLVLLECAVASTAPAIGQVSTIVLAYTGSLGTNVVHTTPLTITNALLGSPIKSVALADSSATLPSVPYVVRAITSMTGSAQSAKDLIDGALILAPGSAIATFSLTVATTAVTHMIWEEIPL